MGRRKKGQPPPIKLADPERRPRGKPKMPEAKTGKRGRKKNRDGFNMESEKRKWTNPLTQKVERLPPLKDFILERIVYMPRWEMVDLCILHYKCSINTVDKYIAQAKEEIYNTAGARRPQRVREAEARFEQLYQLALKKGDAREARHIITAKLKLFGDIQIQQGVDAGQQQSAMDPAQMNDEQILKEINELKRRAASSTT